MTKTIYRLYTRQLDGEWKARDVIASKGAQGYALGKYTRREPHLEHEMRQEEVDVDKGKPAFMRRTR